jgi:immune inhibitor A
MVNAGKRIRFGLALLFFLLAAACGTSSNRTASPTPTATPWPTATASVTPVPLSSTELPVRDLLDLARRFQGYNGPDLARTTPFNYKIGDKEQFSLIDLNTVQPYTITASVRAITDHAYFFVQDDSQSANLPLDRVTADFESVVWPTVTTAFALPWTPGIDSDPRITVLNADLKGAGGYFSSKDEYPPAAVRYGNGREMVYIDASALAAPGPSYDALISHELQHLVHHHGDPNEESWVNEGLSQVAWEMGDGSTDGIARFLAAPDTQLNFWPSIGDAAVAVHYGESELFFDYLLDHYGGRQNAKALVDEQANGIAGVQAYLDQYGVSFNDVFANFVVANLLDLPSGPYSHDHFNGTTTAIENATSKSGNGTVSQFGTEYIHVPAGSGDVFQFKGSQDVTIGISPTAGPFWWSGRSDLIDSKLTRAVDLSGVSAATLNFDTWYDIEDGWDYGYVAVSTDGGSTWTALPGQHTTTKNPAGAAYGPGYTGQSAGWVHETVDLSHYAGEKIVLRFEYITDDSTNLTGFAVDNIQIPEIDFTDTADSANGWMAEGFKRIDGPMPQQFIVQLVKGDGTVQRIAVRSDTTATIPLGTSDVTIAISGATPETTEAASYSWTIERRLT